MNKIFTANTGSFPRIGTGASDQKLRKALSDMDSAKITDNELRTIEKEVTAEAISLQTEAGVDLITDGQIRWNDPVSYIMGPLEGVEIGPLTRFFDTNFYYRQPIINRKVSRISPILLDDYIFAKKSSSKPVKPVITGPYTLARLSVNNAYRSVNSLAEEINAVISQEIEDLAKAGAAVIQIDEPAILQNPEDIKLLQKLFKTMAKKKGNTKLALYTYFGDAKPVYEELQHFPVDILGFDFTYSPDLYKHIHSRGTARTLGLGIIDGRNTKLETEQEIFPLLDLLLSTRGMTQCYINPSCGLEYLPKSKALSKLSTMVKLRNKYTGGN